VAAAVALADPTVIQLQLSASVPFSLDIQVPVTRNLPWKSSWEVLKNLMLSCYSHCFWTDSSGKENSSHKSLTNCIIGTDIMLLTVKAVKQTFILAFWVAFQRSHSIQDCTQHPRI